MNDYVFLIYFAVKFYAAPMLLSIAVVATLCTLLFKSFRLFLLSCVALTFAADAWFVAFRLFRL